MKRLKNAIICLLSMVMLCSSQLMYASAAPTPVSENEVMPRFTTSQVATVGDATATFYFTYSDGNSADCYLVLLPKDSKYEFNGPPSTSFYGDKCYASVVLKHKQTGELVTLNAWCDIYGDTAQY